MKNLFPIIFSVLFSIVLKAQEFSTQIIFEDANGATDTLVIGYDSNASDNIDTVFGEKNIIEKRWSDAFECRFINIDPFANTFCETYNLPDTLFSIHSKKQILGNRKCYGSNDEIVGVVISKAVYPIKIKFQIQSFENDACIYESLITDWHPYSWFDIGGCGNQDFHYLRNSKGEVLFEKPTYSVIAGDQQTQDLLFIYLGANESWGDVDDLESAAYKVYPNPVEQIANIQNYHRLIQVISSDGRWISNIDMIKKNYKLDFSHYQPGVYFLKFENGEVKRIVKK